jgi:uncharacterized protein (TIGR03435 family)
VLEGRITTSPLKPGTAEFRAFIDSHKVLLDAQGPRLPKPDDYKPGFPPSYTVHISPSELENGRGNFGGDSWQNFRGYDLRDIISEVYSITPIRIELPASLDDSRQYDFSLVLPENESREEMYLRFQQAIQDYFYLSAARTTRLMDVYVVTAPDDRKPPAVSQLPEGGGFGGFSIEVALPARTDDGSTLERLPKKVSLSALWNMSGEGSLEAFCDALERFLDRPVVNETNLQGQFEFRVAENPGANGDFLVRLRNELGLAIEPARRNLQLLVFNPR